MDPVIRENYQFWFFGYPSGLACLLAGAGQFRAVLPAAAGMAASLCLVSLCYFGIAALCAQLTGLSLIHI